MREIKMRRCALILTVLFSTSCVEDAPPRVEFMDSLPLSCDKDTPSYFSDGDRVSAGGVVSLAGTPDARYDVYRGRFIYRRGETWHTCKGYEQNQDLSFIDGAGQLIPYKCEVSSGAADVDLVYFLSSGFDFPEAPDHITQGHACAPTWAP